MLLSAVLKPSDYYSGDIETIASFGIRHCQDIPKKYINWIQNLDYFLAVDQYILVHAGLNFNSQNPLEDFTEMLWIRRWKRNLNRDWLGDRIIVHGHTPTKLEEIKTEATNLAQMPVLDIDGGCCFEFEGLGNLVAFELSTQKIYVQPRIDTWSENIIALQEKEERKVIDQTVRAKKRTRVLFFNIENTLQQLDKTPKTALQNGALEKAVKSANFDFLICVSEEMNTNFGTLKFDQQKKKMQLKLAIFFRNKDWFTEKVFLLKDPANRCSYLDLESDWYYLDGDAQAYFTKAYGEEKYHEAMNHRIFQPELKSDGADILEWLYQLID